MSSDVVTVGAKRMKSCVVSLADTLELKLLAMDGNLEELNSKVKSCDSVSKKRDDAPIPIVCWLYWLNSGLDYDISPVDWNKYVVVLQERFLLVWWKRNLVRGLCRWLKMKIGRLRIGKMMTQKLIGLEVVRDRFVEKKWIWAKGGAQSLQAEGMFEESFRGGFGCC